MVENIYRLSLSAIVFAMMKIISHEVDDLENDSVFTARQFCLF